MKQQRQSGSSSVASAQTKPKGEQLKTLTEASIHPFASISPHDDDPIEELLEKYDFQYILERVKQTTQSFPALRNMSDDIASEVYDKLWRQLQKGPLHNPPGYIGRMIHNKCIDYMRRHVNKFYQWIQVRDEELDILESGQVIADSEGLRDPAEEFERKAGLDECYRRVITAIANLSRRQQQATVWHLLRDAEDPLLLTELFNAFHIDIPEVDPENKDEKHLLDASFTHAKKALARSLDIDLSQFKQTKRHPPISSIPEAKVSER